MSTRARFLSLSLVLATAFGAASLRGEEPAKTPELDPAAMQKMMAEYARVTEHHEGFKHAVGKWSTEMTCSMPGAPSGTTSGTATFRLLMGGRFLQQNFQGEYDGQKFTGMGLTGYDNAQKKYVGIWIDNMGTGIMHTSGSYNEKTHVMTETGESVMPTGPMKMKMVTKPVDDDKFVFTMFMLTPDGGEQQIMEITYTRTKKSEKAEKAGKTEKTKAAAKASAKTGAKE
ncbi:MAG: DUF1579 domain-containing protein [Pirellulaceae bacterium]